MQITELEPKKVFHYFSELTKIPRGSGNLKEVREYCLAFAEKRGLESYCDGYGNVMIFKDASAGYEQSAPVILQAHLDMVCEKLPDCKKDMKNEGIDAVVDGSYLRADGTTLGGDDGIGVAYILALLDSEDIPHPPVEALLTADEETGLRGANALDASRLKGRRLINIDSEEEGVITVSCAGAARVSCEIPLTAENADGAVKKITVSGLLGGHSGSDINKNRKNAVKVMGELFYEISQKCRFRLVSMNAGGRLNVITPSSQAVVCVSKSDEKLLDEIVAAFDAELKAQCAFSEPDAHVSLEDAPSCDKCFDDESTKKVTLALMQAPYGVRAMSADMPSLVQTSSNPGEALTSQNVFKLGFMLRSNADCGKKLLISEVKSLVEYIGGSVEVGDSYPAWEYRASSPLRGALSSVYEQMYGKKTVVTAIHAGLECGILLEKLPGADMVSIGPNMSGVHTPDEKLDIKSAARVWEYLLQVLKILK